MNKFKVGDFVEVVSRDYGPKQFGDRGYITEVWPGYYKVKFEGENTIKKQWSTINAYVHGDLKLLKTRKLKVI